MKCTLIEFCVKVVLAQSLEHPSDMDTVFFLHLPEDQDVVQVDDDENVSHVTEDIIHEMLECCQGVGHSKGHYEVLKGTVACAERGLPFVSGQDPDVVVSRVEVDLCEELGRPESVQEVTHQG